MDDTDTNDEYPKGNVHQPTARERQAFELRRKGLTWKLVAQRMGITATTACNMARAYMFKTNTPAPAKPLTAPSEADLEVLALREQGLTYDEIGEKLGGRSRQSVFRMYQRARRRVARASLVQAGAGGV